MTKHLSDLHVHGEGWHPGIEFELFGQILSSRVDHDVAVIVEQPDNEEVCDELHSLLSVLKSLGHV